MRENAVQQNENVSFGIVQVLRKSIFEVGLLLKKRVRWRRREKKRKRVRAIRVRVIWRDKKVVSIVFSYLISFTLFTNL
jgi:hypothetical protein